MLHSSQAALLTDSHLGLVLALLAKFVLPGFDGPIVKRKRQGEPAQIEKRKKEAFFDKKNAHNKLYKSVVRRVSDGLPFLYVSLKLKQAAWRPG